jgi:hypothetical protein
MRIYICDKSFENFDLKDHQDLSFLSHAEGKTPYPNNPIAIEIDQLLKNPKISSDYKHEMQTKLIELC